MFLQIDEVKSMVSQDYTQLFCDETMAGYNWSGKGKKAIKTSEGFLIIKSRNFILSVCNPLINSFICFLSIPNEGLWYNSDTKQMKMHIMNEWQRLSQRMTKRKNRARAQDNTAANGDDERLDDSTAF